MARHKSFRHRRACRNPVASCIAACEGARDQVGIRGEARVGDLLFRGTPAPDPPRAPSFALPPRVPVPRPCAPLGAEPPPSTCEPCAAAINSNNFFGIIEPLLELILIRVPQGSCRELRGDAGVFQPRIGSDKTNFVDADTAGSGERGLQLLSEFSGLGFTGGKGMSKTAAVHRRSLSEKTARWPRPRRKAIGANWRSAGEPSRGTPSNRSCDPVAPSNNPESEPMGMAGLQLAPRHVQHFQRASVLVAVQARKLQQIYSGCERRRGPKLSVDRVSCFCEVVLG